MNDIILGAVASLVASVIWFFGGQLILTLKSREKISFILELLYNCADQFDTAMTFGPLGDGATWGRRATWGRTFFGIILLTTKKIYGILS